MLWKQLIPEHNYYHFANFTTQGLNKFHFEDEIEDIFHYIFLLVSLAQAWQLVDIRYDNQNSLWSTYCFTPLGTVKDTSLIEAQNSKKTVCLTMFQMYIKAAISQILRVFIFFMCWCIYQKNLLRDLYLKVFLSNLLSPKHLEKNKSLGQREPFVITAVNRRLQGRDGI